jgi:hypothetical protein
MNEQSLRELVARLRAHLGTGGALDADAHRELSTLLRDIEPGRTAAAAPASQAAPRLEMLAVRFEASHPALAETLREVIDALGKAGI